MIYSINNSRAHKSNSFQSTVGRFPISIVFIVYYAENMCLSPFPVFRDTLRRRFVGWLISPAHSHDSRSKHNLHQNGGTGECFPIFFRPFLEQRKRNIFCGTPFFCMRLALPSSFKHNISISSMPWRNF